MTPKRGPTCALFCVFAAEWWRREHVLGPWSWDGIKEAVGVSRRQFFNRATVSLMGVSLLTFAAASFVAFLWPVATGGFGGKVKVGKKDEIIGTIRSSGGFFYAPEARAWITEYPASAPSRAGISIEAGWWGLAKRELGSRETKNR